MLDRISLCMHVCVAYAITYPFIPVYMCAVLHCLLAVCDTMVLVLNIKNTKMLPHFRYFVYFFVPVETKRHRCSCMCVRLYGWFCWEERASKTIFNTCTTNPCAHHVYVNNNKVSVLFDCVLNKYIEFCVFCDFLQNQNMN